MAEVIQLSSLVVYNSNFGPKEGEEEKKLLYYYPDTETLNARVNNVGLYEALVQFTRTMSPENSCEFLHTQNRHFFFHEPEEDFWIVMALSNPTSKTSSGKTELKEHAINDGVYQAVLKDIYKRFRLMHGTFLHIFTSSGVDCLKEKLLHFFTDLLPVLRLSDCDLMQIFNGVSYCKVDKSTILSFESFINFVHEKFDNIKYTLVLSDRSLVLTNLTKQDSQILINLLREKLYLDQPFAKRFKAVGKHTTSYQLNHGRLVTGLLSDANNTAYISTKNNIMEQMHVLIYQAFSITTCFLLDYVDGSLLDVCKVLDPVVGPQIAKLAKILPSGSHSSGGAMDSHMKHFFFNRETLAVESSCHVVHGGKTSRVIPKDIAHVFNDVAGEKPTLCYYDEEIINKVQNDYWVATKKTNQKELYVVVNSKNANLIGINDDIRRMSHHFDNLCFSD